MEIEEIIKNVAHMLQNKKAKNVRVLNLKNLNSIFDYFVIALTSNSTHVKSLTQEVEIFLKKNNKPILHTEKDENYNWVLLDCNEFSVNVFHEKTREFHNLEGLWADALEILI